MNCTKRDGINNILKGKIAELKNDTEKLKAVDSLLGKEATEAKKLELVNAIFAVQDVQSKILDLYMNDIAG